MKAVSNKATEQVQTVAKRPGVSAIVEHEHRTKMHQQRQARCQSLRAEFGYLGDDSTVEAMHWLQQAFLAVPSLAKWAATKTVNGRKPGPVAMKKIVLDWILQPACWKTRQMVYAHITEA